MATGGRRAPLGKLLAMAVGAVGIQFNGSMAVNVCFVVVLTFSEDLERSQHLPIL